MKLNEVNLPRRLPTSGQSTTQTSDIVKVSNDTLKKILQVLGVRPDRVDDALRDPQIKDALTKDIIETIKGYIESIMPDDYHESGPTNTNIDRMLGPYI